MPPRPEQRPRAKQQMRDTYSDMADQLTNP